MGSTGAVGEIEKTVELRAVRLTLALSPVSLFLLILAREVRRG